MSETGKRVNLALQGGGAHGAFAWGVLDKLLEDGRLSFEAITATSAGSMNAVALACGMAISGRDGAREKLEEFWREAARAGERSGAVMGDGIARASGIGLDFWPGYQFFDAMVRTFSPYQLNPLNLNPLRDVIERVIDFDRLCASPGCVRLHLSATNVRTGKIRIFPHEELSTEAVLASACLPYIFQAVEIDGEHYWDGGYMGNPAIFPLIYGAVSRDVIIVHINPLLRERLPVTASEIHNRINEITFNSSLMREMRAIAFVTRLIDDGALDIKSYRRMLIHGIMDDDFMGQLSVATKLSPDWTF
ncbi:MAG: patatin-like phospholipase family protein, partial [Pseudomonadota bacterium]